MRATYPGKKPRQDKPVKAVQMIILRNGQGEVLLENARHRHLGLYPYRSGLWQSRPDKMNRRRSARPNSTDCPAT